MSPPPAAPPFLWEQAYLWIRDRILRGEFALGSPLNRRKLAAQLRMSLLPVSEALRKLELDGLVETQRRAGTRVRIPAIEDVEDLVAIRTALECEAARLFSSRATAQDRSGLIRSAEQFDYLRAGTGTVPYDVTGNKDLAYAIQSCHVEFHLRIVDGARCRALRRLMEEKHVLTMHWLYDVAAGSMARFDSHATLAREVAGNDPEQAARAMRKHIALGSEDLLARFRAKLQKDNAASGGHATASHPVRRWRDGASRAKHGST